MIAIRIDKKCRLPQAIRTLIAARLKQRPTHEFWSRFVEIIGYSSFLTGREQDADGELFQASLPWAMTARHFDEILVGAYDPHQPPSSPPEPRGLGDVGGGAK